MLKNKHTLTKHFIRSTIPILHMAFLCAQKTAAALNFIVSTRCGQHGPLVHVDMTSLIIQFLQIFKLYVHAANPLPHLKGVKLDDLGNKKASEEH